MEKYLPFLDHYKLPIALVVLGLFLILGSIFASGFTKSSKEFPRESLVNTPKKISVDVSGAVNKPGVYEVLEDGRVEDAINAAGGFAEPANSEYISKYLNLAQRLVDGTKVYVPFEGETMPSGGGGTVAGTAVSSKVNINSASQSELEALPGIGPVTASKIISGRPYQKIEDLLGNKIVGKAIFEKIKNQLVVY